MISSRTACIGSLISDIWSDLPRLVMVLLVNHFEGCWPSLVKSVLSFPGCIFIFFYNTAECWSESVGIHCAVLQSLSHIDAISFPASMLTWHLYLQSMHLLFCAWCWSNERIVKCAHCGRTVSVTDQCTSLLLLPSLVELRFFRVIRRWMITIVFVLLYLLLFP